MLTGIISGSVTQAKAVCPRPDHPAPAGAQQEFELFLEVATQPQGLALIVRVLKPRPPGQWSLKLFRGPLLPDQAYVLIVNDPQTTPPSPSGNPSGSFSLATDGVSGTIDAASLATPPGGVLSIRGRWQCVANSAYAPR